MTDWFLQLSEEEQDERLRSQWETICLWALEHGADAIIASEFPDEYEEKLRGWGFQPEARGRLGVQWVMRGDAQEIGRVIRASRSIPTIDLRVEANGEVIVFVLDQSWDSIVLTSNTVPDL